jgi:hypothetical protein
MEDFKFTQAQHTVPILSIVAIFSPSLQIKKSTGKGPFKIVYFCLTVPITRST